MHVYVCVEIVIYICDCAQPLYLWLCTSKCCFT